MELKTVVQWVKTLISKTAKHEQEIRNLRNQLKNQLSLIELNHNHSLSEINQLRHQLNLLQIENQNLRNRVNDLEN